MPIRYRIDDEHRVLVSEASGSLDDGDLLDYAKALASEPGLHRADHEYVDLSDVDPRSTVSTHGVRELADFWRDRYAGLAGGRLAIVAPTDVAYGMARMYESLRSDGPDTIRVFRDRDEARAWVGLGAPGAPPGEPDDGGGA